MADGSGSEALAGLGILLDGMSDLALASRECQHG
jgi:hypothetical protein